MFTIGQLHRELIVHLWSLTEFDVSGNELTALPEYWLPAGLRRMDIRYMDLVLTEGVFYGRQPLRDKLEVLRFTKDSKQQSWWKPRECPVVEECSCTEVEDGVKSHREHLGCSVLRVPG